MNDDRNRPQTFDDLYPGRFLHADQFRGKPRTLTVADVFHERLVGEKGKELKVLLSFEETHLLYVLPKLNAQALKAMFGANVRDWISRRVTFYPTADLWPMRRGEECIRVWGSPDIDADMSVELSMPRRKAKTVVLHRVESKR